MLEQPGAGEPAGAELPLANGKPQTAPIDEFARVLIEAVAEKTGYPPEMLELDMRLDTDLGIDSIKRVEILSTVQERLPGADHRTRPVGALVTLRQIAEVLGGEASRVREGEAPAEPPALKRAQSDGKAARREVRPPGMSQGLLEHPPAPLAAAAPVAEPREAPEQAHHVNGVAHARATVLRRLALRARPLGGPADREHVALPAGAAIWLVAEDSPLTEAVKRELFERGHRPVVMDTFEGGGPTGARAEPPSGMILIAPERGCDGAFVAAAFRRIRAAADSLREAALKGGAALLTVSRLDGTFGAAGLASTPSRHRPHWPGSPRRRLTNGPASIARPSISILRSIRPTARPE